MFDISSVSRRYFDIKLTVTDDEDEVHTVQLQVEPPNVKTLKRIMRVSKVDAEDAMDELADAVRDVLSKNKSKYKVPMEYIDGLNMDELNQILAEYFEWLRKEKNDPN